MPAKFVTALLIVSHLESPSARADESPAPTPTAELPAPEGKKSVLKPAVQPPGSKSAAFASDPKSSPATTKPSSPKPIAVPQPVSDAQIAGPKRFIPQPPALPGAPGAGRPPTVMPSLGSAVPQSQNSGPCGKVIVDCGIHEISLMVNGQLTTSPIDCGRAGLTKNGTGYVGAVIDTTNVGKAVDINIPGMGSPPRGTGEVFHLTPPVSQAPTPRKADNSLGCIHVSQSILSALSGCAGTPMEILNASGGTSGGGRSAASASGPTAYSGGTNR